MIHHIQRVSFFCVLIEGVNFSSMDGVRTYQKFWKLIIFQAEFLKISHCTSWDFFLEISDRRLAK